MEGRRTVLFLCAHGALRSVIAAALLNHVAGGRVRAESAGTDPADALDERAVAVLREIGIDTSGVTPARVGPDAIQRADRVVLLGCELEADLAALAAGKVERWTVPGTAGQPVEAVRDLRDVLQAHVERLRHTMEA